MQGRSQDFSKGGHRGYLTDCHVHLHVVYKRAQLYYRGMKAHIN